MYCFKQLKLWQKDLETEVLANKVYALRACPLSRLAETASG